MPALQTAVRILTLLTDFGDRDIYVGVMKGVIARINPTLQVIDLTHHIPPQDIIAGRFNLMSAYPHFPSDTVHVAVVDPGVGSERRAIAIATTHGVFVGPDNGLLSEVWHKTSILTAVELTNPNYWYTPTPSATFQGRDIFAPVGAHLASGVSLDQVGSPLDPMTLKDLAIPDYQVTETGIVGAIQYIDHFGNLVTNIPASAVSGWNWIAKLGNESVLMPAVKQYSDVPKGTAIALIGSHGWVELAINQGNTCQVWNAKVGNRVELEIVHSIR